MSYSVRICLHPEDLPKAWDEVVAVQNRFLSKDYFKVLYESSPVNMQCVFATFFDNKELIGGALLQVLSFERVGSLGDAIEGTNRLKSSFIKMMGSPIMIVGNNLLSGSHGYHFKENAISLEGTYMLLHKAIEMYRIEHSKKACLFVFKDYRLNEVDEISTLPSMKPYAQLEAQPMMAISLKQEWTSLEEYMAFMTTKYRTRIKAAKKKLGNVRLKELNMEEMEKLKEKLYKLYLNIARGVGFNTFLLHPNHFVALKKYMKDNFKCFAYVDENDELLAFFTLILNHNEMDAYFLGYDKEQQKSRQLYLNMLVELVRIGIELRIHDINFGRTALEIKSTIGAEPIPMRIFMRHKAHLLNWYLNRSVNSFYNKEHWVQRRPFKQEKVN